MLNVLKAEADKLRKEAEDREAEAQRQRQLRRNQLGLPTSETAARNVNIIGLGSVVIKAVDDAGDAQLPNADGDGRDEIVVVTAYDTDGGVLEGKQSESGIASVANSRSGTSWLLHQLLQCHA